MLNSPTVVALIIAIPLGAIVALFAGYYIGSTRNKARFEASLRAQKEASEQRLLQSQEQQHQTFREARDETAHLRIIMERENAERRSELQRQEHRLQQKEENFDRKIEALEQRERKVSTKERTLEQAHEELERLKRQQISELERIGQLTLEQAKKLLFERFESQARIDAVQRIRMIEEQARETAEARAREIITLAIQRCASDQVAEAVVSVVPLV